MIASDINPEHVLKAFADPTRREVLAVLQRHELTVTELVEVLQKPQSTISRHLRVLRESGLLEDCRNGNTVMYSVRPVESAGEAGRDLPGRLFGWLGDRPLAPAVHRRMDRVIAQRAAMSHDFFSQVGSRWDQLRTESFGPTFHLEALMKLLPASCVVGDIGSGTGFFLPALAGQFARVIAIEPVEAVRDVAQKRIQLLNLANVELRPGDLSALPVEADQLDLAIAVLVLHHVPTPGRAVDELFRVTRPGGRVLLVEQDMHDHESFRERMQDRWWGFAPSSLSDMTKAAGFSHVHIGQLATVEGQVDAPPLYVLSARKPERQE